MEFDFDFMDISFLILDFDDFDLLELNYDLFLLLFFLFDCLMFDFLVILLLNFLVLFYLFVFGSDCGFLNFSLIVFWYCICCWMLCCLKKEYVLILWRNERERNWVKLVSDGFVILCKYIFIILVNKKLFKVEMLCIVIDYIKYL